MSYFAVHQVPHILSKSPELFREAHAELLREYRSFLRFLLNSNADLRMIFHSIADGSDTPFSLSVAYSIPDTSTADLRSYLRTAHRYLRLSEIDEPAPHAGFAKVELTRRVNLVGVGRLDVESGSAMRILPPDEHRFLSLDPNIATGDIGGVMLLPLTILIGDWVRKFAPPQAYLAPLPQYLDLTHGPTRWLNTTMTLSKDPGTVAITCTPRRPSREEIDYALLCLQYYVGTMSSKLAVKEMEAYTAVHRAIISQAPIFDMQFEFSPDGPALVEAFQRDTDPLGFEYPELSSLQSHIQRDLTWKHFPDSERFKRKVSASGVIAKHYARYFRLEEAIDLLLPPYTFRDALPLLPHFVPRPFYTPSIPPTRATRTILLGHLDDPLEAQSGSGGAPYNGQRPSRTPVRLDSEHLTRHIFVTGTTGSGKTNTVMNLVEQAIESDVPVLMIDPIKRDFEPLMNKIGRQSAILDFTRRDLRFNPFLPPDRITLNAHSVVIAKTLSMLFPTNVVAFEILLRMVKETYLEFLGTKDVKDFLVRRGKDLKDYPKALPTFDDFITIGLKKLRETAPPQGASEWLRDAIEGFTRRFETMHMSAFYYMLSPDTQKQEQSIEGLFEDTHLIEWGSWFDTNEVNAGFALVFAMMYELRLSEAEKLSNERMRASQTADQHGSPTRQRNQKLMHVAVLDEAHRILPAERQAGDTRIVSAAQEAASLLAQMLAECRSLGQGLIIAEQSASKIDSSVLINTGTKIVHTVVYGRDKEFLRSALSLAPAEQDYLSYLGRGEALAFTPDSYQPVYINIDAFDETPNVKTTKPAKLAKLGDN